MACVRVVQKMCCFIMQQHQKYRQYAVLCVCMQQHQKNFRKKSNDMTRCDNVARELGTYADRLVSAFAFSAEEDEVSDDDRADDGSRSAAAAASSVSSAAAASASSVPLITMPVVATPLADLAARPPYWAEECRRLRAEAYTIQRAVLHASQARAPRDMVHVMKKWEYFVQDAQSLCSHKFWKFFLSLHTMSGVAIDSALGAVKKVFMQQQIGTEEWKSFPRGRRELMAKLDPLVKDFWPTVMHRATIDMTGVRLPRPVKPLTFRFIDPVFAWLVAARRQRADEMHYRPLPSKKDDGTPLYGGGVQQGLSFKEAFRTCPPRSYPMCISLHWDGTGAHGVSSAPICIGVANTNNSDSSTQFCLGYVTKLPKMSNTWYGSPAGTTAKFHIRQQIVAAILRVLENDAQRGVLCPLLNCRGREVQVLLMPRLMTMPIDQPEAQLYYGMQNKCTCSKCKRRAGYSVLRKASHQDGCVVERLYAIYQDVNNEKRVRAKAAAKLKRYGFNPDRQCLLTLVANKLLIRVPYIPRRVEVFPCVDWRDKMHGMFIFFHRMICVTALNLISWVAPRRGVKVAEILDQRLAEVCAQRALRGPDGRTYRTQRSIFKDANMSASDKVCMLFYLPYVLGHKGEMVPANVRDALLTAIARCQLMLIAARGRREYTKSEFETIFNEGYKFLLHSMERIHHIYANAKYAKEHAAHARNPDRNPPPKRFKSGHRFTSSHTLTSR